jgi:glycosyltransferase involved in cell wall biosynthesis
MRVLYCNKYNFGFSGTEYYLFELMDLMRTRGHEAELFSMAHKTGDRHSYEHHFVPSIDFKKGGLWHTAKASVHAVYSWQSRRCLREMVRDFKPDIAHVRNIYHHLSPSILWELKAQNVPVIYHLNDFKLLCPSYNMVSHGHACERCAGGQFHHVLSEGCYSGRPGSSAVLAAEAYTHKWLRTYPKCVDRFLAPSEFVKQKLVEHGWDESKIDALPHFQKLPAKTFDPPRNAPALYFGRLSQEKGVADLLEAMKWLPHVKLQIAGDGPQKPALQDQVERLQLKNVSLLGHLQGHELERAISSSCFTVLPTRAYETFGKSIVESYAHARAVIATDLGSRRELLHHGETGSLYPVGDAAKLADAIAYLFARPELAAKMGSAGRELVRAKYSPETHYSNLISLYEQVLSAKKQHKVSAEHSQIKVSFIGGRGVGSKYSGIETYYEESGKHLAAKGHRVTAYCRNHFTPNIKQFERMHLVRLPAIRSKHLETFSHTFLSTLRAMFGSDDIVHFHALGPALFSFLPRITGKKTVVTVQGLDWQRKKWGWLASAVLKLGEKAAAYFPNETIVVSRTLQAHYLKQYGKNTRYVPNGASALRNDSVSRLEQWGLLPKEYVLYLGRFSPEKNCHLLIEAFKRTEASCKLVLAGGSSHSDKYAERLREQANQNILVLDWISGAALNELRANAALFVLPSDLEGLSLALLEAMSAGVCVLASDIPENRELVDQAGFTFKRGDSKDLERMLRLLLGNPHLRQSAAMAGQERVGQSYLWPQITDAVEQIYKDMLGIQKQPVEMPAIQQKKLAA